MRPLRTALLAGAAATVLGLSGAAFAQSPATHLMTVRLPGGGIAQIRYTGDAAPRVSFSEAPAATGVFPPMPSFFGPDSPFAMLDRISAEMDRRAAALFRQAEALTAQARSGRLSGAALRNLPPGSQSYSFISTMSGNGICTQSVQITSMGNGAPPRVVRHSSGDCGPASGAAGSISLPAAAAPVARPGPVWTSAPGRRPYAAAAPANRPDVVWTSAHGAKPYSGLVHEIPPPAQR